jgi:hypothetical protein
VFASVVWHVVDEMGVLHFRTHFVICIAYILGCKGLSVALVWALGIMYEINGFRVSV